MIELFLIVVGLVGGFAAGIYDLKTTNVPDKVCIAMILIGLSTHVLTGIFTGDFSYFIYSLIFGGIFLVFGLGMYYTGQWGGGDGELLVATGVVLPILHSTKTIFPFAISFFMNSFFVGAVWSILYSLVYVYKKPKVYRKFFNDIREPKIFSILLVPLVLSAFLLAFNIFAAVVVFLAFVMVLLLKFSKVIELAFYKRIPVRELNVDDMLGEDIPKLRLYKKHIKGLTKSQVSRIKKNKRFVVIREGIRYGIVFPLALLLTVFFGDLILLFFSSA